MTAEIKKARYIYYHCTGMPMLRVLRPIGADEYILNGIEQLLRHDGLVNPTIQLAVPEEIAVVQRIAQNAMNLRLRHPPTRSRMQQAGAEGAHPKLVQRDVALRVPLKQLGD
jgi:hypothetical protein